MNLVTAFEAPLIAFNVKGKEYIAIAGGGVGVAAFGYPALKDKPVANMLFVFALN